LGISSGAALGAVIAIVVLNHIFSFQGLTQISAFSGAALSVLIVITFIFQTRNISSNSVLLAGVAINFLFASLIMFFQYVGKEYDIFKITRWLLGSVGSVTLTSSVFIGVVFIALLSILIFLADILDLMALGDQLAVTRGVDIKKNKVILIVTVSFSVAIAISFTGPIGFVGIIVPHISRILTKSTHKTLIPFSMFFGGVLLVLCDSIGRMILYPSVMPTGVITAMIGAPFFLILLKQER
jgi:iron complex transport system permease protein